MGKKDKLFKCHSYDKVGTIFVLRENVQQLDYENNLTEEEKKWYLERLLDDVIFRFKVNYPVLFSNAGKDLMSVRTSLLENPSDVDSLIESLAERIENEKLYAKVSPFLNVSNNMALMCAAAIHKKLSEENSFGWRQKFERQVKEMKSL